MAMQMHVIYSETIKGAGLIAGGPYMVGQIYNVNNSTQSLVDNSFKQIDINMRNGETYVDDPKNMHNRPVYVAIHNKDADVSMT